MAGQWNISAYSRDMDFSWKELFRDSSEWWDYRNSKTTPRSSDFKHKITKESRWIHGRYDGSWVQEELRRRGLQLQVKNGMRNGMKEDKGMHNQAREADSNCNHLKTQEVTAIVTLLRSCGKQKDLLKGSRLHAVILENGLLRKNIYIGTALISMYAKCGALAKAQDVFDELGVQDVVSWTALIAGYAQQGHGNKALDCFEQMREKGLAPNAVTYTCTLLACGNTGAVEKGEEVHAEVARQGLLEKNVVLGTALVDMYAKCGALAKAQEVFDELRVRDVVSWSALIAGYAQHGNDAKALMCYEKMQQEGLSPNAVTFTCILQICGCIGAVEKGEQIHAEVVRQGLLEKDIILGTALVDMYARCGALAKAEEVFDELPVRDVVTWNALIAGYAQHGHGDEALKCFERMQHEGLFPDTVTFAGILKACSSVVAAEKGKEIHAEVVKQGLLDKGVLLRTGLVDMYAKCGALAKAQEVFDELWVRDVVSWNALIAGYADHGHGDDALKCFEQMQQEGLFPNIVTFTCILKACGSVGAAKKGEIIHAEVVKQGLLEESVMLGSALVDMYAKCGALAKAQELFDQLPVRNVVSWSALIAGYAQNGHSDVALNCFNQMQQEGSSPNTVTFSVLLNACSHAGLVDEGQMYFESMITGYAINPTTEHHTSMVDLFGRAGHFDKAIRVIEKLSPSDCRPQWLALLSACQKWGDVKIGRLAFERVVHLDERDAAAYVCMSNIYAAAGMHEEAGKVQAMRVKNVAWKISGRSWWTDGSGHVHTFTFGDNSHPQSQAIHARLKAIDAKVSQEGYSMGLGWVSDDITNDTHKEMLWRHSDKLAIACALINTPAQTPIHISKNMQVCGDCHFATSIISKMEKRKIVVRDTKCFHIFENGKCACKEYW